MRRFSIPNFVALALLVAPSTAAARPSGPSLVCATYPDSALCRGRLPECTTCHVSTSPPTWNAFGSDVYAWLRGPFEEDLPATLAYIETLDSDGDGVRNIDEIAIGTGPGDPRETWPYCAPASGYDFERALHRAMVLYCGRSPTYDERAAFTALDPSGRYDALHAQLETCLASPYWRDEGLARLGDPRIRPVGAVGIDSPVGIVIGDYEWDYRLFTYVLSGGRDARELLLADYHVERRADGTLVPVRGTVPSPRPGAGGQPLDPSRRAGMITTQWFLSVNTMFSALPRTTAAQAYRSYLGADIARQQGLVPIAGEPLDVDDKGVDADDCATCHSTLDPLSYAFASYRGIEGANTGAFDATRPSRLIAGWSSPPSMLFGEPVDDVRAWAERAAASDDFLRNLAMMFFQHALEREPTPSEQVEVDAAWTAMRSDGHSANGLLHRLVDGSAFGGGGR